MFRNLFFFLLLFFCTCSFSVTFETNNKGDTFIIDGCNPIVATATLTVRATQEDQKYSSLEKISSSIQEWEEEYDDWDTNEDDDDDDDDMDSDDTSDI